MDPDISIIIPVKNGLKVGIEKCLSVIFSQNSQYIFEVIVIDSGSTDGTLKVIKNFTGIELVQIKSEEFGHGRTRNLGAKKARGKYLVFLNQDAWPDNENWLEYLIKGFDLSEKVAGVYSRQIPKDGCFAYEARRISDKFGEKRIVKSGAIDYFFSTVSAAIMKSIWEDYSFNDNIPTGEDQEWAARILAAGFKIVYEPSSIVAHSHNSNIIEVYKNHFIAGQTDVRYFNYIKSVASIIFIVVGPILSIYKDFIFTVKDKRYRNTILNEMLRSIIIRPVMWFGLVLGRLSG